MTNVLHFRPALVLSYYNVFFYFLYFPGKLRHGVVICVYSDLHGAPPPTSAFGVKIVKLVLIETTDENVFLDRSATFTAVFLCFVFICGVPVK